MKTTDFVRTWVVAVLIAVLLAVWFVGVPVLLGMP